MVADRRFLLFLFVSIPLLIVGCFFAMIELGLVEPLTQPGGDLLLRAIWFVTASIVVTDAALRFTKSLFTRG